MSEEFKTHDLPMFNLQSKTTKLWVKVISTEGKLRVDQWTAVESEAMLFKPYDSVQVMDELGDVRRGVVVIKENDA